VGAGRSQEAGIELRDDLPAGSWTLVADGIILQSVDVLFEVVVRRAGGDVPVVSWQHHFDPRSEGFAAVPFEESATGPAVKRRAGDILLFRYTGNNATSMNAYVPNGDGPRQSGRFPNLTLPR
jgi:hypothetical protein